MGKVWITVPIPKDPLAPMDVALAFVLPDLAVGGVERLTLDLAAAAAARGLGVDLVTLTGGGELASQVPPSVRLINLGAARLRQAIMPLRRYFAQTAPAAVVAAMWPVPIIALLAAAGLRRPPRIIAAEHCPLRQHYAASPARLLALRATLPAYRLAAAVVAVSDGLVDDLATLAHLPRRRIATIANPVPPPARSVVPDPAVAAWQAGPGPRLLTVGRLKPEKNHALLIDALALAGGTARLAIVGEGQQRRALEAQIVRLGLGDRVILAGYSATPGDWYAAADLFVLGSDYEGFGNVLVEAMHHGLPVVSTACPFGPAEVLGHGAHGQLVPPGQPRVLADAIAAALAAPRQPERQRARAAQFGVERALDAYLQAIAA